MQYSFITRAEALYSLISTWEKEGLCSIAMDFEEESNLHCYGEHVCIIQLYDGVSYYILDVLELKKTEQGLLALKTFLEGPIQKIMFACQSDAALSRKALGIQLENVFDIRLIALALGFTGNLTGLMERNLGIVDDKPGLKKKYQTANWMRRPIPREQIIYALGDVEHLFALKASLEEEMKATLKIGAQKQVMYEMKKCALPKNPERPGWEKICNFKLLSAREKVYIKHFFLARDSLAQKANVPASKILAKQLIVAMAKSGTWEGILEDSSLVPHFEKARQAALKELS